MEQEVNKARQNRFNVSWILADPGYVRLDRVIFHGKKRDTGEVRQQIYGDIISLVQLISDQALWTVLVYLSGGVTSGATSFRTLPSFAGTIFRSGSKTVFSSGVFFSDPIKFYCLF